MAHEKTISDLAYELWQARGCPEGSAEVDWIEAERQVKGRDADSALRETFPASDPVASVIPDEPPSNADDKWRAAKKKRINKA